MAFRRFRLVWLLVALHLVLSGCGTSGGPPVLSLFSLEVLSQPPGPQSPFGTTAGGDEVRLMGALLSGVSSVRFGVSSGTNLRIVSDSEILVQTPAGTAGVVDVVVMEGGAGGTATLTQAFRYIAPPVATSALALTGPTAGKATGPIAGGETIEVQGSAFQDGCQVIVDGVAATTTFVGPGTVRCTLPPAAGDRTVDVQVKNPEGLVSTLTGGFFYTQEFSLDPAPEALTDSLASHLYRRAGLGAAPAEVAAAVTSGLTPTVAALLDFANDTTVENDALALYGATPPPAGGVLQRTNQEYWFHLLLYNPNPLQERIALFLHGHFAASQRAFPEDAIWWMYAQVGIFRKFSMRTSEGGFGYDWKRMCIEVAKDRAMLEWLNGLLSTKQAPNENFAREMWELFMLGEGNGYTQADIVQASRAYTGFNRIRRTGIDYAEVVYQKSRHDETDKTIFGVTGKFGYDSVAPFHEDGAGIASDPRDTGGGMVALTLAQRPVEASTFICRKLAAFFLYDDPHDSVVSALAADLRANDWNMKPVLDRMLKSKAMFSLASRKRQIKSPVEFSIQLLRDTNLILRENLLRTTTEAMGQALLDPPDVNGWPGGESWLGAQASLQRINFVNTVVSTLNDVPTQIDPLLPPVGQRTPAQMVDHLADLLDVTLPAEARAAYIAYVNQQMVGGQVLPFAFDPDNAEHRKMKTRGLLYMIGQHHDGQRQ